VSTFELGVVLPVMQEGPDRSTARWQTIRDIALRAEAIGFPTIWTPDELLWRAEEGSPPRGFWEGVSMAGAVAAVTSTAKVGTWVMSALHRNPGIIAKAAETLDMISGGRFVFGLGAGHEWPGQAHAFGLPEDHIFGRFEEALEVIIPPPRARADAISGSAEEIADSCRAFREVGFTQLEMMYRPGTVEALEALAPVLELVNAD
jgi:luciferase-like monooxygenase